MRVWTHDRFTYPLPDGHRYPAGRYALLRARLEDVVDEFREAEPAGWDDLGRVHDAGLLDRLRDGRLTEREARALGLPWSERLIERGRRATAGTVCAAREALRVGVAMNLGGGTHHAGFAFARGYCLFNDVALTVDLLRREGLAQRFAVVDCDVHQGDGTADLLGEDRDLDVFTLSLHGARNYPFKRIASDLDVDLPSGTGDDAYLEALRTSLDTVLDAGPYDLAFYLAGADPWEGDRLGRLALTKAGLRARDALVVDTMAAAGIPVAVTLAGGYAPDLEDLVDINAATVAEVAARTPS